MMSATNNEMGFAVGTLLNGLVEEDVLRGYGDMSIYGLAQDSRRVAKGDMFLAYAGEQSHGLLHVMQAIKNGAVIVLWDGEAENRENILNEASSQVPCFQCRDLKMKMGNIADRFYGEPSSKLDVIGVTGTDGKTSVSHFIAQCLDEPSARCGVMGTLGNGFMGDLKSSGLTTSPVIDIHKNLSDLLDRGAKHVVMEVSSHGLDQGRVNAVAFDVAVFTNISQDHLDYHGTFEEYALAKKKLFSMPGLRAAVINLDDDYGLNLARECNQKLSVWGYSLNPENPALDDCCGYYVCAQKVTLTDTGYRVKVKTPKGSGIINIALHGKYNVSNVLATLAVLLICNVDFDEAVRRLQNLHPVTGRMEVVRVEGKPTVIIDYAHTPNALSMVCQSVAEHCRGKLWCVFGCGGDRDKVKRPLMARAAEQFCDKIVVTSDNPRHEEPEKIIEDITKGFASMKNVEIIIDRRTAIQKAITQASGDDIVLLAGKGHEGSQIIGNAHIALSDIQVARKCLGVLS